MTLNSLTQKLEGLAEKSFYEKQMTIAVKMSSRIWFVKPKHLIEKELKNKKIFKYINVPLAKNDFLDCFFLLVMTAESHNFTPRVKYDRKKAMETSRKINYGIHKIIAKREREKKEKEARNPPRLILP